MIRWTKVVFPDPAMPIVMIHIASWLVDAKGVCEAVDVDEEAILNASDAAIRPEHG